jgi:GxxExxY protein
MDNYLHSDITSHIIRCFYLVYNKLGYGFLEKVYQNALLIELRKHALTANPQQHIKVLYDEYEVGFYIADIIVEDKVIIEVKASEMLCEEHEAQLVNYLRATNIEVGMLLNFGKKAEFKRKVFSAEFKNLKSSSAS